LQLLKSTSGFVLNYPNFEIAYFWPQLIEFLGPSWVTNTVLLENKHLHLRNLSRLTNNKNPERDSMDMDWLIQESLLNEDVTTRKSSSIPDGKFYGRSAKLIQTDLGKQQLSTQVFIFIVAGYQLGNISPLLWIITQLNMLEFLPLWSCQIRKGWILL